MKSSEVTGLTVSSIRFTINLKSFLKLILVMDKSNLFFENLFPQSFNQVQNQLEIESTNKML